MTNTFFKKIRPEWILRLGLGLVYLYSGFSLFSTPQYWHGYVPQWFSDFISSFMSIDLYLRMQGVGELAIGFLFLAWFGGIWGVRIASLMASAELLLITLFAGIDLITTFRDIGLLAAALAMVVISFHENAPKEEVHAPSQIHE